MLQLIEQSAAGSLRDGRVQRPSLGITIDGGGNVMRHLGVRRLPGVLVMGVAPGTPAAEAGVRDTTRDGSGRVVVRTFPPPHLWFGWTACGLSLSRHCFPSAAYPRECFGVRSLRLSSLCSSEPVLQAFSAPDLRLPCVHLSPLLQAVGSCP